MWVIQINCGIGMDRLTLVAEALNELGIPFTDVSVLRNEYEFVTPIEVPNNHAIPYGSTSLVKIAEQRKWTGLFFDHETFSVDQWTRNRKDMLNQDSDILTVSETVKAFANKPSDEPWFIRPVGDLKKFNGMVTSAEEIRNWLTNVEAGDFETFKKDDLIAIAEPQEILMEWRYFVVNREVISGSSYRHKGLRLIARENDEDVLAEAQSKADDWLPHECCVMDLALTKEGLKVVEFNCINASGFYYHDVKAVVKAITDYHDSRIHLQN
jgi:hypothetical protein